MQLSEKIARVICQGCEENPDEISEELGHIYRWEDYEQIAIRVIEVFCADLILDGR